MDLPVLDFGKLCQLSHSSSSQSPLCPGSLVFWEACTQSCWPFFPMARIYLMESYVNVDANWIQPRGAWPVAWLCSLCWKTVHHCCSKGNFQARHSSSFFPYKGYCASALN